MSDQTMRTFADWTNDNSVALLLVGGFLFLLGLRLIRRATALRDAHDEQHRLKHHTAPQAEDVREFDAREHSAWAQAGLATFGGLFISVLALPQFLWNFLAMPPLAATVVTVAAALGAGHVALRNAGQM